MESFAVAASVLSLLAWVYLAFFHGRFWRADQWIESEFETGSPETGWPAVDVVVPARNEEDCVGRCLASLLEQDYPGEWRITLVDDQSDDATGDVAKRLAKEHPQGERLHVERSGERPPGWVGKMWAVHTGVARAKALPLQARFLLLTDADVEHHPGSLRRLVRKAEAQRLDLVSLMVRLHCERPWEKLLIPAFVYFFQQLFPFPRINDSRSRTAGAAGGCMLVRAAALEAIGGIERIRDAVIDDCALGAALKERGPIWLGLSQREFSFRPYRGLEDIWNMVARSAYTQLDYSPWRLAGTVVGLGVVYIAPPVLTIAGIASMGIAVALPAAIAWSLLNWTYVPMARLYALAWPWRLLLPVAGLLYTAMTLDSGLRHHRGRGATWKDRVGAGATPER